MTATCSDQAALVRAVCAAPQDDSPRLVYADWLDDNGQPERAEFIRVQCELARARVHPNGHTDLGDRDDCPTCPLRRRERNLWNDSRLNGAPHSWIGTLAWPRIRANWLSSHNVPLMTIYPNNSKVEIRVARGFVSSITLSTAAFLGGPCDSCRGAGRDNVPYGETCDRCGGTGKVDGVAGKIFGVQPIERVMLSDAVIHWSGGNMTCYVGGLGSFPKEHWRRLDGLPSQQAAREALSAVCVDMGRSLVDLPPLNGSKKAEKGQ